MTLRLTLHLLAIATFLGVASPGHAAEHPWLGTRKPARTLQQAFAPPPGFHRVALEPSSFGAWLRDLPLLPANAAVHLWNGQPKGNQAAHVAVVDLDVENRDLQQCADVVMRLRAEYLWARGRSREITFRLANGGQDAWKGGDRAAFVKYLRHVFTYANTGSLRQELAGATKGQVQPGDVLVQPPGQHGKLGHAVLVLDAAEDAQGQRVVLIGQSYTPAQQFEVLANAGEGALSPWYRVAPLGPQFRVQTPEWYPFVVGDVRRFPGGRVMP